MPHFLAVAIALLSISQGSPQAAPDGIKRLEFLIGNWTSTEKMTPKTGEPVEFTLHGKNDWALGGTALRIEESFELPGGTAHNFILMTYDARGKAYLAYWFTNSSPRPLAFSGQFDGANLILTTVRAPDAPGADLRITYKPKSATEIDATLEIKSGDKFEVRTVAKYVKGK